MKLPPYSTFPSLIIDKIELNEITASHIKDIIEISYYDGVKAADEIEAQKMLDRINDDYSRRETVHWGIFLQETNQIVGTCGYYRGFKNNIGEIGCVLLPNYRKQGFMTLALKKIIEFGFTNIKLEAVIAITKTENERAKKLLGKLFFEHIKTVNNQDLHYKLDLNKYLRNYLNND